MKLNAFFRLIIVVLAVLALVACGEQEDADTGSRKPGEPTRQDADSNGETAKESPRETVEGDRETVKESATDCQLTMGWDPWEPYQYRDPRGEVSGLDVDLVNMAAERAGCEISFHQEDFADLLTMIQNGEVDLVAGATHTEERSRYARFSRPYRQETFSLFVRQAQAESVGDPSLKDLLEEGFEIGITEGFFYGDEAEALITDHEYTDQFKSARVGELNLFRLVEDDIDALLEDPFVAASIQRRLGLDADVARVGDAIRTGDVHLMFSRRSVDEDVVARFDDALHQLIESGERDRVLQMYVTR